MSDQTAPKRNILVVDDNISVRTMLVEILEAQDANLKVHTASNGKDALDLFDTIQFELVITDEVMPRMGGSALFKEIRSRGIDCPVIIITGLTAKEITSNFTDELTNYNVVEKPIRIAELTQHVKRALKLS